MLFLISREAMNANERVLNCLDTVVGRIEDSVHELEIHDADALTDSFWYQSSRPGRRKFLEEVAALGLRKNSRIKGPHLQRVVVENAASAEIAKQLANTPLSILLENADSDGALITAALTVFGEAETRRLFLAQPSKLAIPAISIESRGGHGELKKLVEAKIAESIRTGRPQRCVVVTDSDGEFVGEVKDHALEIRNICAVNAIPCPPLNKRTAENYIPDQIWDAWSDGIENSAKRPMVEALQKLSNSQRDHIRMDNGNKDPWDTQNTSASALFSNVSQENFNILKDAVLKGRGATMTIHALNSHSSTLTAASLNARDPSGDLAEIVRQIEDQL